MLNSLRNSANTWVAKLLLVLLVLSFAVWGISGTIMGGLGTNVVTAGDTKVSILEYRLAYDRQLALLSRQFGTQITREQAQAFGVDQQVLAQLVAGAVLDEQAREMRLGLSKDRLAALTAEDPAFRGPGGGFDRQQFEFVLNQVGMRPQDYLQNREQAAVRQQIVEAVSDGMDAPDAFLRAVALYEGEDRTVEFIVLPRTLVEPVPAPSEEEIAEFFEENKADYAAPEYRSISYVKLEPEDIADPSVISDEQAREYYERNADRYTEAEQRRIEQLVFADQDAADAALERLREGASFEEIVAAEGKSLDDVVLGTLTRERIADPAIAEAAFALDEGEVSDVVPGSFGPILLRVTEITPESATPFDEVSDEITRNLALDEASRILLDVYEGYEDARAGGDSMAEAAERQRLEMVTVEAVDRNGRTPEGTVLTDLPLSDELLEQAFETDVGIENPPLDIGSLGYLFYEVDEVTPARERTLDEVRDEVVADWVDREAARRLGERAAEIEKQIADGTPMAEIATGLDLEVQTRRGLTRDGDDADLGSAGVQAAFGIAQGETAVVPTESGDARIVLRVAGVTQPMDASAETLPESTRDRFARGYADDLLEQLVAQLQMKYPVTIDRGAIQQALSF